MDERIPNIFTRRKPHTVDGQDAPPFESNALPLDMLSLRDSGTQSNTKRLSASSGSIKGTSTRSKDPQNYTQQESDSHHGPIVSTFFTRAKDDAMAIIHEKMPQKMYELEKFMQQCSLFAECSTRESNMDSTLLLLPRDQPESQPKWTPMIEKEPLKLYSEQSNRDQLYCDIRTWICSLRTEILEFFHMVGSVKLYIELNIPRIEDGNNFGVSVQEDTLQELLRAEEGALQILDDVSKYYSSRAKLLSKIQKYPDIDDYKIALAEVDMKQIFQLKMNFIGTRNGYAALVDMLQKNLERIMKPRSTALYAGSMY